MTLIRLRHKYLTWAITPHVIWIRYYRIYFYMRFGDLPILKYIWKEKKYARKSQEG